MELNKVKVAIVGSTQLEAAKKIISITDDIEIIMVGDPPPGGYGHTTTDKKSIEQIMMEEKTYKIRDDVNRLEKCLTIPKSGQEQRRERRKKNRK